MTEFSAKKLGEVLAFAQVGMETFEKGKEAFGTVLENIDAAITASKEHADAIVEMATSAGMGETTLTKAEGTGKKLRAMRDLYVADQWDNATELMEWHGFFEGAAIVHWALVKGAAEGMGNATMNDLADKALAFHQGIFDTVNAKIQAYAKEKETAA